MQLNLVLPSGRNNVQQSVSLILCINPDIAVVGITASVDVQRVGLVDDRLDAYGGGELGEQPLLFLGSAVGPQSHILAIAQRSQVAPLNVETLASTNVGNTVRLCPMGIQRVVILKYLFVIYIWYRGVASLYGSDFIEPVSDYVYNVRQLRQV